jgi:lysyl endopeptidase
MKQFIFSFLFCVLSFVLNAQISEGGVPFSLQHSNSFVLSSNVPVEVMPKINIDSLRVEDEIFDTMQGMPWRFGYNFDVSISMDEHGLLEILPDESKLWRLSIHSVGAQSVNLLFDNFHIPHGSKLFIYNQDKTQMIGAFTSKNNQDDMLFATTLIKGELITIEYYEPSWVETPGYFEIMRVTHAYRGVEQFIKAFGNSDSCNVNVACPEGLQMEDQVRSVCMLVTGSNGFCSGVLINNVEQDQTPYILSANHCFTNPGSLVVWFNWESPSCDNPLTSPPYNSMSGATSRAREANSDFWLFELNQAIPSSYNVFFSGWNRTMEKILNGKVWGIHHPTGDIKKISWSYHGVTTTAYLQETVDSTSTHWRISKWSDGTTTEGGSSGSPLYDPMGRIIGQLHGGWASCNSITSDWYGKFGVSWTGGGTNETRLSNWLDPNDSGVIVLNGFDPIPPSYQVDMQMLAVELPHNIVCGTDSVSPRVIIKNKGVQTINNADVQYSINGSNPIQVQWSGSLQTGEIAYVSFPAVQLYDGVNQLMTAIVTNPNGVNDEDTTNNELTKIFTVYGSFTPPFSETFEGTVFPPPCWSEEVIVGNNSWTTRNGGNSSSPPSAFEGQANAWFHKYSTTPSTTKLITPQLDIRFLDNPILSFQHAQVPWGSDQDELRVYYKNSPQSNWVLLAEFTDSVNNWTQQNIPLPNSSSSYFIAFEGTAKYGHGVCIDDVLITGSNVSVERFVSNQLHIYPNPTNGEFVLVNPNALVLKKLIISNMNGSVVYSKELHHVKNDVLNVDVVLSKGVYLVHIIANNHKEIKKLIVL